MKTTETHTDQALDHFDADTRLATLESLTETIPDDFPDSPYRGMINMHMHSFFSYNAYGWSPSRIAWEARKAGLQAAGLCDFDVLDGLEEFIQAGHLLGLRTAVGLETRAFLDEMADLDISSPGEPGVTYIMGMGFVRPPVPGTPQAKMLASFREQYDQRNQAMVNKINAALPEISVDYKKDAMPLTPNGGVTERHLVRSYRERSAAAFADRPDDEIAFWSAVLEKDEQGTRALRENIPAFEEAIRAKLTKKGGIGYEQPSAQTFPPVDLFIQWVAENDALPMITWLDGTSAGEADPVRLLECLCMKGAVALNIIPDRNWNLADAEQRARKVAHLDAMIQAAKARDLPINIGTEMNKDGLPFADDLQGPVLGAYRDLFLQGAHIMVGHTLMARYASFGYGSPVASGHFQSIAQRNAFFAKIGAAAPVTRSEVDALLEAGHEKAFDMLIDRAS